MQIANTLRMFVLLLALALLLRPVAGWLRLPLGAVLVVAGFLVSEALVMAGYDTGLRWDGFRDLVMLVFLPLLIFESAFQLDLKVLSRNLLPVMVLALPVLLVTAAISAVLLYHGIGHPTGFPWMAALMTATLLAATDPVAVLGVFRSRSGAERLGFLVEGEGLASDATAIVMFMFVLQVALGTAQVDTLGAPALAFATVFFGGILVGLLGGALFAWLIELSRSFVARGIAGLVAVYGIYLSAELALGVSGVMAVLVGGVIIGRRHRRHANDAHKVFMERQWELQAHLAYVFIFLLAGFTITTDMFAQRWLAMLVGIGALALARAIAVYGLLPLSCRLPGTDRLDLHGTTVVYWGGVRGAVTLALALSIPIELDYWWTVQSIAYGAVLFTLFVQAPTLGLVIDWATRAGKR